jgi:deoxyribose-phosphate aldolase
VATGFPAGQTSLKVRLDEIKYAVESGALEIDVVINRRHAIAHDWDKLYDELREMREACGPKAHMKTILAVGELSSFTEVYQASMVAMMAGSDFIKTSTGTSCSGSWSWTIAEISCIFLCQMSSIL